jgi:hypothetical protein
MTIGPTVILYGKIVIARVRWIDLSHVEPCLVAVFTLVLQKNISTTKVTCH